MFVKRDCDCRDSPEVAHPWLVYVQGLVGRSAPIIAMLSVLIHKGRMSRFCVLSFALLFSATRGS